MIAMTKPIDFSGVRPGRDLDYDHLDEIKNYDVCPVCEEAYDMRDLSEAWYHDSDYHEPLHTLH